MPWDPVQVTTGERIMPQRRFKSIEEWKREEQARRRREASRQIEQKAPLSGDGRKLRVEVEFAPHADSSAIRECRSMVLEWLQDGMERKLPRKALRHRSFALSGNESACRAARIRDGRKDRWAAQFERNPAAGQATVVEVIVGHHEGRLPVVGIEVVDRSVVPADSIGEYPAELLAAMAQRVPLLQQGRALSHWPVAVDSAETMQAFHRMLVDPRRETPFAVVSVPPEVDDPQALRSRWRALARALTGLAIVWSLPPAMTYRLSDLVGKPLSVFLGAWRFYRPGFDHRASKSDHPLFLKNRMDDERGVAEIRRQFLLMAAEERMRAGAGSALPFDYRTVMREAGEAARGPGRLISFLGSLTRRPAQRVEYSPAPPGGSAAAGRLLTDRAPDQSGPAPAAVREPAARAARRTARSEVPLLRRKLRAATEKARTRSSRYERVKQRAAAAERERDEARRRAEQLAGLVRSLGGNPDAETPFPTMWPEFAPWCEENLAGRLVLAAPAGRELAGAEFEDVGLAARCLNWLALDYRDARLQGGDPRLHGRIEDIADGVFNLPCGGDSFECSWEGRRHRVEWHIKRGANTRNPRRCLRIYYFWDEETRQVVVASMPAHRRSALT